MKRYLFYLSILFSLYLLYSCSSGFEDIVFGEEEFPMASRSYLFDDEIDIEIADGTPLELRLAVGAISKHDIGKVLLRKIKGFNTVIYFSIYLDDEGNPKDGVQMGYGGSGKIYYTSLTLQYKYTDELVFHEFFHLYQNTNNSPRKTLNNEIEAYMAQYLYAKSKGGHYSAVLLDGSFDKLIREMASYIDEDTGVLRPGIDYSNFLEKYNEAMNYLANHPSYASYERLDYCGFPALAKLLSNY